MVRLDERSVAGTPVRHPARGRKGLVLLLLCPAPTPGTRTRARARNKLAFLEVCELLFAMVSDRLDGG